MFHDIYNAVPSWVALVMIATVFMGLAAGVYWLLRHVFPKFTERGNLQAHSILVGILASTYGIMLGFIIVILWQAFMRLENTVSAEASELALIVADSYALPAQQQHEILDAVTHYIKIVRGNEWESMRRGEANSKTLTFFTPGRLFATMLNFQPKTYNQQVFYQEIIAHLNKVVAYRRERINAANSSLPNTLRAIIVISAILIIIFICVLQSQRKRPDILKILLVSGVMAANVGLVFILDYPFSADISVNSDAFTQGILANFKL